MTIFLMVLLGALALVCAYLSVETWWETFQYDSPTFAVLAIFLMMAAVVLGGGALHFFQKI